MLHAEKYIIFLCASARNSKTKFIYRITAVFYLSGIIGSKMRKAYLGIKYHADLRNREQIEGITAVLAHAGFSTTCVVRDVEKWGQIKFPPQILMQKTFAIIKNSDLAVIDLSEKGVGLGIEAGYAFAHSIPLVTIAQVESDISTTLAGISDQIIKYGSFNDLLISFKNFGDEQSQPTI